MVTQVLRLEKERADGAILPIQDIYKDVCCSDLGTFFPVGGLFASYATLIVTAKDEPEVQELVVGEDMFLMTCHREVAIFPTGSDARSFSTEAYCQWKNCYLFNMADGAPRLVLGRVLENAHWSSHFAHRVDAPLDGGGRGGSGPGTRFDLEDAQARIKRQLQQASSYRFDCGDATQSASGCLVGPRLSC